jgi:hypothetical protein
MAKFVPNVPDSASNVTEAAWLETAKPVRTLVRVARMAVELNMFVFIGLIQVCITKK